MLLSLDRLFVCCYETWSLTHEPVFSSLSFSETDLTIDVRFYHSFKNRVELIFKNDWLVNSYEIFDAIQYYRKYFMNLLAVVPLLKNYCIYLDCIAYIIAIILVKHRIYATV